MDPTQEEIKAKQDILQKEIIDKNYDKTDFINFCLSKKENGDDLNSWTLDELKLIIQNFQEIQNKKKEQINQNKDVNQEIDKNQINKIENFNNESQLKNFNEEIINCRKLEKTKLNDNNITVTLKNPKENNEGLLSNNYVTYEVITEPFKWSVQRRYSDFDSLRRLLIKFYPGYNVPPLPNKKMGNRRFDADFILKRMKFLELFISSVVMNESFKASEFLVAFLSYEDRNKFEAKFKEFHSTNPSIYVEDYKTLDGKVIVSHDVSNEKYFKTVNKYFRLQTQIFDNINYYLKQFYNNINEAANNLEETQKHFELMHLLNTKVLMKQTITKTYEELGAFCKYWRRILIKQNDMFKNHFKDFFKFVNLEGKSYINLIDRREELLNNYTSQLQKVTSKKEKLYLTGDVTKFELNQDDRDIDKERLVRDKVYAFEKMCYKDTKSLKMNNDILGYANKMNIEQLKLMMNEYCIRYIRNFKKFDENFYTTINDMIGTWTNMETFVQSIYAQQQMDAAMEQAKMSPS